MVTKTKKQAAAGSRKSASQKTTSRKTTSRKTASRKTTSRKTTSRKTASQKTAAQKTAARKTASRKTAARKTAARKTASKSSKAKARNKGAQGKATRKARAGRKLGAAEAGAEAAAKSAAEMTISFDELEDVDALVADATPGPVPKARIKKSGPRTPTVPRSVKPPPKEVEMEMDDEILAFVEAIDAYRQENCRPFPTWTEVFFILKQLGYRKSCEPRAEI